MSKFPAQLEEEDFLTTPITPIETVSLGQKIRRKIISRLTDAGTNFDDLDKVKVALSALKDADIAAQTERKLDIEERVVDTGRATTAAFKDFMAMMKGNEVPTNPVVDEAVRDVYDVVQVESVPLKPGEGASGEQALSISDYMGEDEE